MAAAPYCSVCQVCQLAILAPGPCLRCCTAEHSGMLPEPAAHAASRAAAAAVQVACGLNLTLLLTVDGRVFQAGATGAAMSKEDEKAAFWEGAHTPERVGGALEGMTVEEVGAQASTPALPSTATVGGVPPGSISCRALHPGGSGGQHRSSSSLHVYKLVATTGSPAVLPIAHWASLLQSI
jgi:hypothetical protein